MLKGLPNQDVIRWVPGSGVGLPVVLAVADGHGSETCFRSDVGAELAVSIAIKHLLRLVESYNQELAKLAIVKDFATRKLPQLILDDWSEDVIDHIFEQPFAREQLLKVQKTKGVDNRRRVIRNPLVAYGSTLLSVLITEFMIIYEQLGDGNIITVFEDGHVDMPIPIDKRLMGNETTSLCGDKAALDFRVVVQEITSTKPPVLILVSTDGFLNSYASDNAHIQIGTDYLSTIRNNGIDYVSGKLETWLTEITQEGSGDDMTLGLIYREIADEQVSNSTADNSQPVHIEESAEELSRPADES